MLQQNNNKWDLTGDDNVSHVFKSTKMKRTEYTLLDLNVTR